MSIPNQAMRVVVVDDHFLFSLALQSIIKKYDYLETVAVLSSGGEAIARMEELKPDIILLDITKPIINGCLMAKTIIERYPNTKIIAITDHDEGNTVKRMMEAGAWGYITKDSEKKEYDELFTRIVGEKKFISSNAAINYALLMSEKSPEESKSPEPRITEREIEIIKYVAKGYSDKEIAKTLNISHRTIDAHKQKMMHKLGTRKSAEIVAIAYKMNLI